VGIANDDDAHRLVSADVADKVPDSNYLSPNPSQDAGLRRAKRPQRPQQEKQDTEETDD
jgi:hypothetical protein